MTSTTIHGSGASRSSAGLPDFLTRIASRVGRYISLSRAERQLEALDDRLLLDIGLARSDIHRMVWGRNS